MKSTPPLSWGPFTPYLSLGQHAIETGVTITSSSKAWNTAGLKAGFLITQSDQVRKKLSRLPDAMQWRSSILGANAMVAAYESGTPWLDETVNTLQENLEHLRHEVATRLPKAKMFQMEATYLAWIDLEAYRIPDLAKTILSEAKVSVNAGPDHSPQDDFEGFIGSILQAPNQELPRLSGASASCVRANPKSMGLSRKKRFLSHQCPG